LKAVKKVRSMSVDKVREIFIELVGNVPPDQWEVRLAELAGANEDLRRRVQQLLVAHRQADSFLDAPAAPRSAPTADAQLLERPGTVIGPYKLLQEIGEGGMGTVFMAEQTEPVQRQVALKIVKPGMDSRQVIARFEAERQALR
jgi:hypothetical protein